MVSDDGSADDTAELAEAEIDKFRYAHGEVLTAPRTAARPSR